MVLLGTVGGWWFRYVIVPMIGGGGIVALSVAVIERKDFTFGTEEPARAATTAPYRSPAPATSPVAVNAPQQPAPSRMPQVTAPPVAPPKEAAPRDREHHRPYFYATDADDERYPSQRVFVKRGDSIGVHWVVDPSSLTGVVHIRSKSGDRTTSDVAVDNIGAKKFSVESPMTIVLTEVRPDGERFLADLDIQIEN